MKKSALLFVPLITSMVISGKASAIETWTNPSTQDKWVYDNSQLTDNVVLAADRCHELAPRGSWSIPKYRELGFAITNDFPSDLTTPSSSRKSLGLWDVDFAVSGSGVIPQGFRLKRGTESRIYRHWSVSANADTPTNVRPKAGEGLARQRFPTMCVQRALEVSSKEAINRELYFGVLHDDLNKVKAALAQGADPVSDSNDFSSARALAISLVRTSSIKLFYDKGYYPDQPASDFVSSDDNGVPKVNNSRNPFVHLLANQYICTSDDGNNCHIYKKEHPSFKNAFAILTQTTPDLRKPYYVSYTGSELFYTSMLVTDLETSRLLLGMGLNPDIPMSSVRADDPFQGTRRCALSEIVSNRSFDLTKLLVDAGANVTCSQVPGSVPPIEWLNDNESEQKIADLLCSRGARAAVCLPGTRQGFNINIHVTGVPLNQASVTLRMLTLSPDLEKFFVSQGVPTQSYGDSFMWAKLRGRINSTYEVTISAPGMKTEIRQITSGSKTTELQIIAVELRP